MNMLLELENHHHGCKIKSCNTERWMEQQVLNSMASKEFIICIMVTS